MVMINGAYIFHVYQQNKQFCIPSLHAFVRVLFTDSCHNYGHGFVKYFWWQNN